MSDPAPPPPPPKGDGNLFSTLAIGGCVLLAVGLAAVFVLPGFFATSRSPNSRNASSTLKVLAAAEADFRSNDRDENGVNDYWVGDIQGLYELAPKGEAIKLVEIGMAEADAFPTKAGGTPRAKLLGPLSPKSDHYSAAIRLESGGKPYHSGDCRNREAFGFCTWPARYPEAGKWTFILSEDATIWKKDNGGRYVERWPSDPAAEGWIKAD